MRHSLMRRFTVLSTVIMLIVLSSFVVILHFMTVYSLQASSRTLDNNHQQVLYRLEEYFDAIDKAAYTLCYSPTVQSYISTDEYSSRLNLRANMHSVYSSTYLLMDSLIGIAMFDDQGEYIASSNENVIHLEGLPEAWRAIGETSYTGLFREGDGKQITRNSFAVLTPIYSLYPGSRLLSNRIGTIVFTFSTDYLSRIVSSGGLTNDYLLVLADRDGAVLAASTPDAAQYYTDYRWQEEAPAVQKITILDAAGWTLYSFLPRSGINDDIRLLLRIIFLTSCVFLTLIVLLLVSLNGQVLHPIHRLSVFMSRVAQKKTKERFVFKKKNELGLMISVFNDMLDALEDNGRQLRETEALVYKKELSRREMEIMAYRNQINPHFLYNTLDCIRGMALYYHSEEIAAISESLSTMFRYAVKGESFATVAQEVEHVREYATIIDYRFMHRIHIAMDIAAEAEEYQMLKLSLQPLVENAVFHGLERKVGEGQIQLSVLLDADTLILTVQDNGVGMTPDALAQLQSTLEDARRDEREVSESKRSIGLTNIARRLHLFYGSASSISIESMEGKATTVVVRIPARKEAANVSNSAG